MSERTRRFGFWLASAAILVFSAAVAAPSPVYPLYQAKWGLSPAVMTGIFGIYVAGLLVGLLTAGSLSDHVGRRPVILPAVTILIAALLVLGTAGDPTAVWIGRVLEGVAMSLVVGSLGATLLDLAPPGNLRLAATFNGSLWPLGLAAGAVLGGALVEFAPDPSRLVFFVLAIVTLLLLVALWFLPTSAVRRPGALASLRPTITMPAKVRGVFLAVLGCLLAAWALGGLYLGLGASVVATVFHIHAALAAGLAMAAVTGVGAVTGILVQRRDAVQVMIGGSTALVLGPALMIVAVATETSWLFFVASVISGTGFGAGFQGGLRLVLAEVEEDDRAGVLSSVYVVCYCAFCLPALAAGFLTPSLGLREVVLGYAVLVIVMAAAALLIQLFKRSARVAEIAAEGDERAQEQQTPAGV
ncbi:MFS transporter [Nocardioides sp. BP30]|uniref:MFS transporter n=1 Tax=Nocardioides sp. BP30 TaxID=3036374 RepID=UPI002468A480|nr:MFS transporter [Nocardioides sp. BP30]WGL52117.1 MFS transporter [Nocardioides sp. BP30]